MMGINSVNYSNITVYNFPYFYGASNVNSYGFVKMNNLTTSFTNVAALFVGSDTDYQYIKRSSDNKTVYWYNTRAIATNQFNGSGYTYIFMGVC